MHSVYHKLKVNLHANCKYDCTIYISDLIFLTLAHYQIFYITLHYITDYYSVVYSQDSV